MGSRLRVGEWCPGCLIIAHRNLRSKTLSKNRIVMFVGPIEAAATIATGLGTKPCYAAKNLLCMRLFFKKFEPARPLPLQGRAHRVHRRERWRPGGYLRGGALDYDDARQGCLFSLVAHYFSRLERAKGIEPSTYSLGSCRSTTELRPRSISIAKASRDQQEARRAGADD
jgi:hypothetical protein